MLDTKKGVEPTRENKSNLPPADTKNTHVTSDMNRPEMFLDFGYRFFQHKFL
jgi:hypothetical protein